MSAKEFVSVGQLYKQDLDTAYILPFTPTSYRENSRFANKHKYQIYDFPTECNTIKEGVHSQQYYPVIGDEFPILTDRPPPEYLTHHWKKWLPAFKPAKYIGIDEGLKNDDIPIVVQGAFENIPRSRHNVDPDVLYQIHSKSAIPEIGASCPRHMDPNNVQFPCVVKIDWSYGGNGNFLVKNEKEFSEVNEKIRENGWKGKIIYQEFIEGIEEFMNVTFYVNKTGEAKWLGADIQNFNGFKWMSATFDWNNQEHLKKKVYDDLVIPVAKYLHKKRYFGIVDFEAVITAREKKLVDLNPRLPGGLAPHFIAPYMAKLGFPFCLYYSGHVPRTINAESLVAKANQLNESERDVGRVLILAAGNGEKDIAMRSTAYYAKTSEDCEALHEKMEAKSV